MDWNQLKLNLSTKYDELCELEISNLNLKESFSEVFDDIHLLTWITEKVFSY